MRRASHVKIWAAAGVAAAAVAAVAAPVVVPVVAGAYLFPWLGSAVSIYIGVEGHTFSDDTQWL